MLVLALLARPFVELLSFSTRFVLRLLGVKDPGRQAMTEEELHLMLDEGSGCRHH
jgi:putative hemolysin